MFDPINKNEGYGFLDGEYVHMSKMNLPVTDLGFQLSDMCYDMIRVYNGNLFRLDDHLNRFMRAILLRRYDTLKVGKEKLSEIILGCVSRSGLRKSMVTVSLGGSVVPGGPLEIIFKITEFILIKRIFTYK